MLNKLGHDAENAFSVCLDDDGYIVPILFVRDQIIRNNKNNIEKLLMLKKEFKKLKNIYFNLFQFENDTIYFEKQIPKKTKIFSTLQHYNRSYQLIREWILFDEIDMEFNHLLQKIKRIDDLYEYYCLMNLLQSIKKNKYILNINQTNKIRKESNGFKSTEICNVFVFEQKNRSICLWYQPTIYDDFVSVNEHLDLYRLTSNWEKKYRYYKPDFVLTRYEDNSTKFDIFDAKYSNIENCNKYYLKDAVRKYGHELVNGKGRFADSVWLLSGKNTENRKKLFYNSPAAEKIMEINSNFPNYGIVTLLPKAFENSEYSKILDILLRVE